MLNPFKDVPNGEFRTQKFHLRVHRCRIFWYERFCAFLVLKFALQKGEGEYFYVCKKLRCAICTAYGLNVNLNHNN